MRWVRCPRCHTVTDLEDSPECAGCGVGLKLGPPSQPSQLQKETKRDRHVGMIVLGAQCALFILGLLLGRGDAKELLISISIYVLPFTFWIVLSIRVWSSRLNWAFKIFLSLVVVGASLFGFVVLVFVACSVLK